MTNQTRIVETTTIETMPAFRHMRDGINLPNYILWYGLTGYFLDMVASRFSGVTIDLPFGINLPMPAFCGVLMLVGIMIQEKLRHEVFTAESVRETIKREEPPMLTVNSGGESHQVLAVRGDLELSNGFVLTGRQLDILDGLMAEKNTIACTDVERGFWDCSQSEARNRYKVMRAGLVEDGYLRKVTDKEYRWVQDKEL